MRLGYGKGKYASTDGYRFIDNVVGVDIQLENGYRFCVREHGYAIMLKDQIVENVDFNTGDIMYELECPNCKTTFEKSQKEVGKEPFDIECPDCKELVGSEFVRNVYRRNR